MFDSFVVLAGKNVLDGVNAEQVATCAPGRYPGTFKGTDVCALQIRQFGRGIRGCELVLADLAPTGPNARWHTPQGWTVRSDTNLDGKRVLACVNDGDVDGSYESALAWALNWASQDPDKRYVLKRR